MSFTIQGRPVNVKYSPEAISSRISFEFAARANLQSLSAYRTTTVVSSITAGTSSAAFTCVMKFIVDQDMEDCDVLLGSEWRDVCDAKCNFPISLATLSKEDSDSDSSMSSSINHPDLPSVPPAAAIYDSHKRGVDFSKSGKGSEKPSDSATEPEDKDAPFTYHTLPFYFQFRRKIDKSG